jgi:hypothetical protein
MTTHSKHTHTYTNTHTHSHQARTILSPEVHFVPMVQIMCYISLASPGLVYFEPTIMRVVDRFRCIDQYLTSKAFMREFLWYPVLFPETDIRSELGQRTYNTNWPHIWVTTHAIPHHNKVQSNYYVVKPNAARQGLLSQSSAVWPLVQSCTSGALARVKVWNYVSLHTRVGEYKDQAMSEMWLSW